MHRFLIGLSLFMLVSQQHVPHGSDQTLCTTPPNTDAATPSSSYTIVDSRENQKTSLDICLPDLVDVKGENPTGSEPLSHPLARSIPRVLANVDAKMAEEVDLETSDSYASLSEDSFGGISSSNSDSMEDGSTKQSPAESTDAVFSSARHLQKTKFKRPFAFSFSSPEDDARDDVEDPERELHIIFSPSVRKSFSQDPEFPLSPQHPPELSLSRSQTKSTDSFDDSSPFGDSPFLLVPYFTVQYTTATKKSFKERQRIPNIDACKKESQQNCLFWNGFKIGSRGDSYLRAPLPGSKNVLGFDDIMKLSEARYIRDVGSIGALRARQRDILYRLEYRSKIHGKKCLFLEDSLQT